MLTAIALGFLLGLRHASDPDHVIAVSTIVARFRRPALASWIGVAWGVGHSLTLVAVGAAIVALRLAVPANVALGLELAVGLALLALGIANLRDARALHASEGQASDALEGRVTGAVESGVPREALARAFAVGLVHGLAGSAAIVLLALAAMPGPGAAIAYLALFGAGTIGGMVAISLGVGVPLAWASGRASARRWIVAGSGALSFAFGAWIVIKGTVLA